MTHDSHASCASASSQRHDRLGLASKLDHDGPMCERTTPCFFKLRATSWGSLRITDTWTIKQFSCHVEVHSMQKCCRVMPCCAPCCGPMLWCHANHQHPCGHPHSTEACSSFQLAEGPAPTRMKSGQKH